MVSHNFTEAIRLADRIGVMKNGAIEEVVDVKLGRPRHEDDVAFTTEVHNLRSLLETPSPSVARVKP